MRGGEKRYETHKQRHGAENRTDPCAALFTVEPFGVVLGGTQRRDVPQAPVDDGVTSREVDHRSSVQLAPLCHHGGGVVARVIGTPGNAVHRVQHMTDVTNLTEWGKKQLNSQQMNKRKGKGESAASVLIFGLHKRFIYLIFVLVEAVFIKIYHLY